MIPKSGHRFWEKIMLNKKLAHDPEKWTPVFEPQSPASCPRLSRASTCVWLANNEDVDGRDKPGHDELGQGRELTPLCANEMLPPGTPLPG
jgi:hypothetical protein